MYNFMYIVYTNIKKNIVNYKNIKMHLEKNIKRYIKI